MAHIRYPEAAKTPPQQLPPPGPDTRPQPRNRLQHPDLAGPPSPTPPPSTSPPTGPARFLSPATRRFDLTEKRELYRQNAVAHLWLVDPDARSLEAFTLASATWTLAAAFQDGDAIRAAPFEALTFPLNALWPHWHPSSSK